MTSLGEIAQPSDCSLTHTLLAYWRKLLIFAHPEMSLEVGFARARCSQKRLTVVREVEVVRRQPGEPLNDSCAYVPYLGH
jgi:hypothetical protein